MKCFEKIRSNFRIPEPDEIILDRVIAKNIDAAVPYCTFVDNGSMKWKVVDGDNTNALILQTTCIIIFFSCVKHDLYTICS